MADVIPIRRKWPPALLESSGAAIGQAVEYVREPMIPPESIKRVRDDIARENRIHGIERGAE